MKRKAILFTALSLALATPAALPMSAYAAETPAASTTIAAIADLQAGSTVSIKGTSSEAEVIIKVIAPDNTVLFFDIAKTADGKFTASFTLPGDAQSGSICQVVAGQGTDVAKGSFRVTSGGTYVPPVVPGGDTGSGNNGGNAGETTSVQFKLEDVPAASNGTVTLDAKSGDYAKAEIKLPVAAAQKIGDNSLQLLLPSGSVTLPPEVIADLANLAGSDKDASFWLQFHRLTTGEAASAAAGDKALLPQGQTVELTLGVVLKDGTSKKLGTFAEPVTLKLQLTSGADSRLTGIYYISDSGAIEYIGGTIDGQTITAEISHFSKYGVFAYKKAYTDVPASYWASDVIAELTAKHVVQGLTLDSFGPKAKVTRAEFVTMLVRALDLKATAPAPFGDVKAGSWYADATAAAYENGIASGTGAGKFEPNKSITREEMASMIVRVYNKLHGGAGSEAASGLDAFKDAKSISSWAKSSVQAAVEAGLMVGSNQQFYPRSNTTRAEAAQVLYNLLYRA
ncbi:S-layer homology domain-containing protein [Paenibacillus silvisoli]|uniref:S-layer homology domain-containing protein n=1 Tax=Paenibacillus silvisoli TaxID=3110539 RepID=UPI0028052EB2|nr:S-layer homology domain-containing protein [Paenibacillus silvisoli]